MCLNMMSFSSVSRHVRRNSPSVVSVKLAPAPCCKQQFWIFPFKGKFIVFAMNVEIVEWQHCIFGNFCNPVLQLEEIHLLFLISSIEKMHVTFY